MADRYTPHLDELSFRTKRLISGDLRNEDVATIFLALRERPSAGDAVTEIGDLVAHRFVRDRGPLRDAAQERFDALVCMGHATVDPNGPLPPRYWATLRGNLKGVHPRRLWKDTGVSLRAAKALLRQARDKFEQHVTSGAELRKSLTRSQTALFDYLIKEGTLREPFTDRQLISELNAALKLDGISGRSIHGDAAKFVTLFAISKMHNTALLLENGTYSVAQIHPTTDKLIVWLETEAPSIPGVEPTNFMAPHFRTSLREADHCDVDSIRESDGRTHSLEATSDLRLSLLK